MKKDPREAEIIRDNIRRFRTELRLSQDKFAFLIGVPSNTASTWEQESKEGGGALRTPSLRYLKKMSELLGRPLEHFFLATPPAVKRKTPTLPVVAFKIIPDDASPELQREVEEFKQSVTRKYHLEQVLAAKEKEKGTHR
jgi:transcriptional regulator with XRE-family HTH domain